MDRLRAMRVFSTVARAGSLSAAARQLGQPLTTVSRLLAALEGHLGTSLITRTTRRLSLTDAGRDYLEISRRVLDEIDAAESRIAGRDDDLSGELAVTAPVVFGRLYLLPILVRFLALHPRLDARLTLSDRVVDLAEEGIDVALRIAALPDSALIAVKVGTQRVLTCAAPAYLRKNSEPKSPADLALLDCIAFSTLPREGHWMYKSAAHGRRSVRVRPRLSVNTAEAAVDAAAAGLGVTRLLSYQAADALARKRLKTVLDGFDDTEIPVHLVHRAVRLPRPQVRLFIDFAARELRARLGKHPH
ncbi:MAG: LysR family transcriptional regulator [Hyphomicrobium sp.]|jgi:DNA-binding transcriptional LysR family regulator